MPSQTTMPFQKYSLNFLHNYLNRYAALSATALVLGVLLYGCGENRISQCNKFVTVANKTKTLAIPKDVSGFVPLAENIDQIRTEAQAIALQDKNLKKLQGELLGMYGDVAQSLKSHAKANEAKDKNAIEKAKQELAGAARQENDIVDRINALCSK